MRKYKAEQDVDAEDPRTWDEDAPSRVIVWDGNSGYSTPEWTGYTPFEELYRLAWDGDFSLQDAVEIVNRWDRVFHGGYQQLAVKTEWGHSQSDWWELVYVTGSESLVDAFVQWLRGDVWVVYEMEEETCDMGHVHETVEEAVGGWYADSKEDAIRLYKEETK